jgi:hypothetical protein
MYKEITSIVQSNYGINSNITKTISPSTSWRAVSSLKYITREMIEKYKNIYINHHVYQFIKLLFLKMEMSPSKPLNHLKRLVK